MSTGIALKQYCQDDKLIQKMLSAIHSKQVPLGYFYKDNQGKYTLKLKELAHAYMFLDKHSLGEEYLSGLYFPGGKVNVDSSLARLLILRNEQTENVDEFAFDEDSIRISEENKNLNNPVVGCGCIIKRKGFSPLLRTFSLQDAKTAGLINKGKWREFPVDMMAHKAFIRAARFRYPDIMSEVNIVPEHEDLKEYKRDYEPTKLDKLGESEKNIVKELSENGVEAKPSLPEEPTQEKTPIPEEKREKIEKFRKLEQECRDKKLIPEDKKFSAELLVHYWPHNVDAHIKRAEELLKGWVAT